MQSVITCQKALKTREGLYTGILIFIGIILRVRQYLFGRSLWLDEAMLALNIVNRNAIELFKPLDYDQGAPVGFLLIEKLFNLFLGRNEYALRLFPLTLGLLSLWIFYLLLKELTNKAGMYIALSLFVFNPVLIYYSSEVKQYIGDSFTTILPILMAVRYINQPDKSRLTQLALAGCLGLWLSHPSLFILAGIGTTFFISSIQKRDTSTTFSFIGIGILWLANISVLYFLTLKDLRGNSFMMDYWEGAFAPAPLWSDWSWFWHGFQANAIQLFSVSYYPLFLLLIFICGFLILYGKNSMTASIIGSALIFSIAASSLQLYPLIGRMALYLIPIGCLLAGISFDYVMLFFQRNRLVSMSLFILMGGYLFWSAVPNMIEQFIKPKYFEHLRPTMEYLESAWQDGDALYVSYGGVPAFKYYAPMYGLDHVTYITGERDDYNNPAAMSQKLDTMQGEHRVWVLFSHVYEQGQFNERDFLVDHLEKIGDKTREYRRPETSVFLYLFDLAE